MYKNVLRAADQYFGKNVTLPAGASATAPNILVVGEHHGSLGLCIAVGDTPVALAAGKQITITLADSDKAVGPFTALPMSFTFTFAAGISGTSTGDMLLQLVLPDCGKHVQVTVDTNDSSAAGTIDVFMNYLAR